MRKPSPCHDVFKGAPKCSLLFLTTLLGFLYLSSSGSANAQLPGCFRPWTFSFNIGLNMLTSDSFMSCKHSLLGYREVPGFAADCPYGVWCRGLTTCPLRVGPLFGNKNKNDSNFVSLTYRKTFCCFLIIYILMPHNMIILNFRLPYFHSSKSALFSTYHFSALI